MIKYSDLNIDTSVISDIVSIGNSCGVITCYFLSLIYDFKFDISEFRNIGEGLTEKRIQEYAERNGVSYLSKEKNGKNQCSFVDFDILLENDICMTISGSNTNDGNPHTSVITSIANGCFSQLFSSEEDRVKPFRAAKDLYLTFYYKNCDIDKFVEFH